MVRSYVESLVPFGRCKCRYRPELWLHYNFKTAHKKFWGIASPHHRFFTADVSHRQRFFQLCLQYISTQESQIVQSMHFSEPKILRRMPSQESQIFCIMSFQRQSLVQPCIYRNHRLFNELCFSEPKLLSRMPFTMYMNHRLFATCLSQSGRFFQTCIYKNQRLLRTCVSQSLRFVTACLYKVHESQIFCSMSFSKT